MNLNLVVSRNAFTYLANQRGEFSHLKSQPTWMEAYHAELQTTMNQLNFYMRVAPKTVLDIGCGLGAIDVLIMNNVVGSRCVLVDGEDGDGVARKYDEPFCSREVVKGFMGDNKIADSSWSYHNPAQLADDAAFPVFDLVLSLRSWCFHYPPATYLSFVQRHVAPRSMVLLDVRKRKREWRAQLDATWKESYVIDEEEKFERIVYMVGGHVQ